LAYQYVREPLRGEEADELANACETPLEKLVVWTLLDTGLRVSELCSLSIKDILWQQKQIRVKGKGGPYGSKTKQRIVPMSARVRKLLEWHFAESNTFPIGPRRVQKLVKEIANRAKVSQEVTPHVLRHNADSLIMPMETLVIVFFGLFPGPWDSPLAETTRHNPDIVSLVGSSPARKGKTSAQATLSGCLCIPTCRRSEEELSKVMPRDVPPGRCRPDDELSAFLEGLRLCRIRP
jgi:integrase/recombinase XerD